MRLVEGSRQKRRRRWPLYLVAVVCFGPLVPMLLLGLMFLPIWLGQFAAELANPDVWREEGWQAFLGGLWLTVMVVAGVIGFAGLFLLLALRPDASMASRRAVRAMVFVGLAGLFLTIGLPFLLFGSIESVEQLLDVGFAIYFVLPLVGAFWILRATWNELFPLREPRKELSACAERATPFSSDPKRR